MATFNASQNGNWSNPATWGGAGVPGVGDSAIINGYTVDLDQDVEVGADGNNFKAIQISNGKLKFPRNASRVLTFEGYFEVLSGGHLDIGDENDPILDGYIATLNFKRTSLINNTTLATFFGNSGIITCNAEKGQSRYVTTLAENVTAGSNIAVLIDVIDILPGDEVYIMGTEDNGQGEKMTVQSWNAATKTVTLTSTFAYNHTATENTYCVVLTRPIVINKKSHTYGGNISLLTYSDIGWWNNVEIKSKSDAYGANGTQDTYTKYPFCDYTSEYGWFFQNCCLNETDIMAGSPGNTYKNLVAYRTPVNNRGYNSSARCGFYHGYVIALNCACAIAPYDAVIDLYVLDDYSPGAVGYGVGLTNQGLFGYRSVIKKFVVSGDTNYYTPRFEGENLTVLKLEYGYPLSCYTSLVSWYPTYQPSIIRNMRARFNAYGTIVWGSPNRHSIVIVQNWEKDGIPQADTVLSPLYSYALDNVVKKDGAYSFKAIVNSTVKRPTQISTTLPTAAGKLLTVSGFWRHNGNFVNRPTLRLTESGFNTTTEMPAAANEWHPFVLSGVADFNGFAKLQLVWHGDTVGGEWWIDNITINSTRIDLGGMEFFGDNIFPPVILKTELDAADILRQSIASYTDSGTVGEALNELALLRKLSKNKREIDTVNNQIVFYDDDGTTELLRINIYNAAGDPAYKNITKWVPV